MDDADPTPRSAYRWQRAEVALAESRKQLIDDLIGRLGIGGHGQALAVLQAQSGPIETVQGGIVMLGQERPPDLFEAGAIGRCREFGQRLRFEARREPAP